VFGGGQGAPDVGWHNGSGRRCAERCSRCGALAVYGDGPTNEDRHVNEQTVERLTAAFEARLIEWADDGLLPDDFDGDAAGRAAADRLFHQISER
jgi:hypothetical protein